MSKSKIHSFDEFVNESKMHSLNEGAIPIFGEEGPFKQIKSMRVVDVIRDFTKMLNDGVTFTVIADTDNIPGADEAEYDVVGVSGDKIKIRGKKGNEYFIKAGKIIEIQIGNNIENNISVGISYLIEDMRGIIRGLQNGVITVKLQNGEMRDYTLEEWKKGRFTEIGD